MRDGFMGFKASCLLWIFLIMNSCGLMKKTEKKVNEFKYSSDHRQQTNAVTEKIDSSKTLRMFFEKDDVQSTYLVQLWPKGTFKFSADNGFEGEADRILISGQVMEQKNRTALSSTEEQHREKQVIASAQTDQEQRINKEEIREIKTDFRWVILVILLLIVCCTWAYCKFFYK